jgi:hypothetical protein
MELWSMEIICNPPKQLIILECTHYPSVEALARVVGTIISAGESVILKWAEGVVFSYTPVPPSTDMLVDEYVKGKVYWSDVVFAVMPEYKQTIRVSTLDIPVIDVSPNPALSEIARWMKNHG